MVENRILGIVFSNMHDEEITDLTTNRTTASVPFGARYRLIDFTLSNLINSGIDQVGVITKRNYKSLMDHVGSGKEWDLARKRGGLALLPPFSTAGSGMYRGNVEALSGIASYIRSAKKPYVVLTDCDIVANIDYKKAVHEHISTGAAMTLLYQNSSLTRGKTLPTIDIDENGLFVGTKPANTGEHKYVNMCVVNTEILLEQIEYAMSQSKYDLITEVLPQMLKDNHKVCCYKVDGVTLIIEDVKTYYTANMELLKRETRKDLFDPARPISTKVRDEVPVKYGLNSKALNCVIADGCIIEGEVTNSVIFRGVTIAKGAKVSNCILMQGTEVGENSVLDNIITDKNVIIDNEKTLKGDKNYPFYIAKGRKV